MSREIKFRAWIQEYDDCPAKMEQLPMQLQKFDFEDGTVLSFTEYPQHWAHECYGVAKPFVYELMQFTGLKDKNGTDIYEGDVCRGFKKEQDDKEGVNGYWLNDTITYRYGGFCLFSKNLQDVYTKDQNVIDGFMWHVPSYFNNPSAYYQINEIEVIGNRFQNPELL